MTNPPMLPADRHAIRTLLEHDSSLNELVSQPSGASDPTLADQAASEESQALVDGADAAAGAQAAQAPDLYARALEKLDEMETATVNYMFFRDNPQVAKLLRALLLERQAQTSGPFVDFGAQEFAADAALREFAGHESCLSMSSGQTVDDKGQAGPRGPGIVS